MSSSQFGYYDGSSQRQRSLKSQSRIEGMGGGLEFRRHERDVATSER